MTARLRPGNGRTKYVLPGMALVVAAVFAATAFRGGWTRAETDFPNYYTAAVLVTKGEPLRHYYEWTWFQRQMNYAGVENQLGAYIPQTPLTMLPLTPLAGLAPQNAKRVWLLFSALCLAATIVMLSRVTRFGLAAITLVTFVGWGSLESNFLLGQYYVFLLFLLTWAFYEMQRGHTRAGGILMGVVCGLKLYGAPFLLFFAAKRHWKAAAGMVATLCVFTIAAIAIFGWTDTAAFATQILPRSLAGETIDPYHPGNGTLSTLLRRSLVMEPELNPSPIASAPGVYFFLQAFATVTILVLPLLVLRRSDHSKRDFAWFVIVLLLASPNTAPYTFIMLLLPILLLLEEAALPEQIFLLLIYFLLTWPTPDRWGWLFPKVWLLLALLITGGRRYRQMPPRREILLTACLAICAGSLSEFIRMAGYAQEPGRRFERVALQRDAIYSSTPAVLRSGIVYESIGMQHYVLRWQHGSKIDEFAYDGEALNPVALSADGPVQFELVAHRKSTFMVLDPSTGETVPEPVTSRVEIPPAVASPDGMWLATTVQERGSKQVWLRRADGSSSRRLSGGACNSFSPAWELDSKAVIFASDCGRGLGLPGLYRAPI